MCDNECALFKKCKVLYKCLLGVLATSGYPFLCSFLEITSISVHILSMRWKSTHSILSCNQGLVMWQSFSQWVLDASIVCDIWKILKERGRPSDTWNRIWYLEFGQSSWTKRMGGLPEGWGREKPSRGWVRITEELMELPFQLILIK